MADVIYLCSTCAAQGVLYRDGLCKKCWREKKFSDLLENGPLDSVFVADASDEELDQAVCDGNLNLCMAYVTWHQRLLEAWWEVQDGS